MSGFDVDVTVERRARSGSPFRLSATFESAAGITVVYGPSGAGKSTLELAVLGVLRPQRGRVVVAGRPLFDAAARVDVPLWRRAVGMVFQDAPLFPHLDVRHNVALGARGPGAARRVDELLVRVGATELSARRPDELSGGQRQRVALARALAPRPRALLLDEPFSALDAAARQRLGTLLHELQRETGIPFLHVTHDLAEALRLGDTLVLLDGGRVVQTGSPVEVIARPASVEAARVVGTDNLLAGTVLRHAPDEGLSEVDLGGATVRTTTLDRPVGAAVTLGLRAEEILLSTGPVRDTTARNLFPAVVHRIVPRPTGIEVRFETPLALRALVTSAAVRDLGLVEGRRVWLLVKASAFHELA